MFVIPAVLKTKCVKILAELLNVSVQEVLVVTKIVQVSGRVFSNPRGVLPIMTCTGRLRPNGIPFPGFRGTKE